VSSWQPPSAGALTRAIGLTQATAAVAGIILGAAIFVQPSEIARLVPSVTGVLLVWTVCGLLTLVGALVCAELAAAFPQTGGVYIYLKEMYSPLFGFLWGWAMFWSIHSGIVAATAVIFARYAGYFAPLSDVPTRAVAIAAIVLVSAVNYIGVRHGSATQSALTLAKVAAVMILLAIAFTMPVPGPGEGPAPLAGGAAPGAFGLAELGLALIAGLYTFGGWHMVTYAAGETRNPQRTIPRALLLGTLIVTACYIGLNAAYLRALPLEQMVHSTRVAADAATALAGPRGAGVISALVMVSALGTCAGVILAGPRVYYAMAQDGLAFAWLGQTHPRFQTPHTAIVLQGVWSSLLVATGTYRALFTRVVFTEWIFFALLAAGIFLLRRKPGAAAARRVWGHPVTTVAFIGVSAAIVMNQVFAQPRESLIGIALVASGIPAYYLWRRRREVRQAQHM